MLSFTRKKINKINEIVIWWLQMISILLLFSFFYKWRKEKEFHGRAYNHNLLSARQTLVKEFHFLLLFAIINFS